MEGPVELVSVVMMMELVFVSCLIRNQDVDSGNR